MAPSECSSTLMTPNLSQIWVNQEKIVVQKIIMLGISPMTTEIFIARGALFRRKRLAICNFPRDQQRTCAASSNATFKPHALLQNTMAARGAGGQLSSSLRSFVLHKPVIHSHTDHASLRPPPSLGLGHVLNRLERHPHALLPQVKTTVGHKIMVSARGSLSSLASMIRKMVIQMTMKCVAMDEDIFLSV